MLESLIPQTNSSSGTNSASQIHNAVLEISNAAVELDGVLRMSRADLKVFMTAMDKAPSSPKPFEFGFNFDHSLMELTNTLLIPDSSGTPGVVNLTISPGILKHGAADGTRYDQGRVLVKLRAVSNLQMAMLQIPQQPQRVEQAPFNMAPQYLHQPALVTPKTKRQAANESKEETHTNAGKGFLHKKIKLEDSDVNLDNNGDVIMQDADIQAEVKTARFRGKSEPPFLPRTLRRDITFSHSKTHGRDSFKASRPKSAGSRSRTPQEKTTVTVPDSPGRH